MLTPAMQQYYDIKNKYNDCIIFFRMGDFYEMFWEDAKIAHEVLWISITSRNKNSKNPELLAWIPYHAKDKYLWNLVSSWYKVAIVEQVSDPKLKWIVKREVVRVVTPSTLSLEWDNYDNYSDNSLILSIAKNDSKYGFCIFDINTNNLKTNEFFSKDDFKKHLLIISPNEVIVDEKLRDDCFLKEIFSKKQISNLYYFSLKEKEEDLLLNHFKLRSLESFGIQEKKSSIRACSLIIEYLNFYQKQSLDIIKSISIYDTNDFLQIDDSTFSSLDIVYNFATKSDTIWTLFWVLNKTKTKMWKRTLKKNLYTPLCDIEKIKTRQQIIESFQNNQILLEKIIEKLKCISDLDAILNRVSIKRASYRDLVNLKNSLVSILEILELIKNEWSKDLKKIFNL